MTSWKDTAAAMLAQGYTYAAIGKAVGRTAPRVHRVLNPKEYKSSPKPTHDDTDITKKRRLLRRWCRRAAERTGRPVEELYAANGVQDLDRVALWDERKQNAGD